MQLVVVVEEGDELAAGRLSAMFVAAAIPLVLLQHLEPDPLVSGASFFFQRRSRGSHRCEPSSQTQSSQWG